MKLKFSLLIFLVFGLQLVKAQDKVYKKDGTVLEILAVEQTSSVLKYRMTDYADGPILWMPLNKIKKIVYKNGLIDNMGSLNPRLNKPFSANLNLLFLMEAGGVVPMVELGYFIYPQIEITGDVYTDFRETFFFAVGPKFHLAPKYSNKIATPFIGILFGDDSGTTITKIPVGLNFAFKIGLNASLSYSIVEYWRLQNSTYSSFEVGMGWRF